LLVPAHRQHIIMTIRLIAFALIFVCVPAASGIQAGEPVSVRVSVARSFEPADLHLLVRVEPCADNRWLQVIAESRDFYRSSTLPLDGERSARVTTMEYRGMPAGEYEIVGVLRDTRGRERARARTAVHVIASGSER
jgi:hypothetical protein